MQNSSERILLCCALLVAPAILCRADEAADTLALAQRTLDYVSKSVPEKVLKPYADELKLDAS